MVTIPMNLVETMYDRVAVEGLITIPGTCLSPILTHTGSLAISDDNGRVLCLLLK